MGTVILYNLIAGFIFDVDVDIFMPQFIHAQGGGGGQGITPLKFFARTPSPHQN